MAIAFRAAGALVDGTDEILIPVPAGTASGDILVAVLNSDSPGATSAGWTAIVDETGNIAEQLTVLWRRAGGSEPADYDFFVSTNGAAGVMLAFSGCLAAGDPIGAVGLQGRASASATVTAGTVTPPSDNNGVVFVAIAQDAVAVRTCSGYSGTLPTFSEVFDGGALDGGLGLNLSIAVALGVQASAAATGARTATLNGTPVENQGVMFALLPAAAGGGGSPSRGGYRVVTPT